MSAYLHLFVRKGNEFVPIATYGRATLIYEMFDPYAPWEKIAPINGLILADIGERLRDKLQLYKSEIEKVAREIEFIATTNNPIDEKLRAVAELQDSRAELESQITEIDHALHFISFLSDIRVEAYEALITTLDGQALTELKPDSCLYAGIECGRYVSVTDIQKVSDF